MTFNDRLKEARLSAGFTQEEVAEKIGVAKSTLAGYEKGNREPSIPTVQKIMKVLSVDANYLYQDSSVSTIQNNLNPHEINHIKKYRSLSNYDKETVDTLVNRLSDKPDEFIQIQPPVLVPYYGHIASAGTGQYVFDDIPPELIEVDDEIADYIDFAVGVNGDSMYPTYSDGDILLIKKQSSINVGEIGIFMINGEAFVKEYQKDKLISHNSNYPSIKFNENMDIKCVGKVIDAVRR